MTNNYKTMILGSVSNELARVYKYKNSILRNRIRNKRGSRERNIMQMLVAKYIYTTFRSVLIDTFHDINNTSPKLLLIHLYIKKNNYDSVDSAVDQ